MTGGVSILKIKVKRRSDQRAFIGVDYGGHEFKNPAFCVLDPNEPVEIVSI